MNTINDRIRTNLAKERAMLGSGSRGDTLPLPTTGQTILKSSSNPNKELLKFAPNIVR